MYISSRLKTFIDDHMHLVDYDVMCEIDEADDFDEKTGMLVDFVADVATKCDYKLNADEFVQRNVGDDSNDSEQESLEDDDETDFDTDFDFVDDDDE